MQFTLLRRFSLMLGLLAILGLLAVACGEEEEEGPTPSPAATTPAAAALLAPASGGSAEIGGAGIPRQPRQVPGLEGVLTLDDGLAAWKERPADEDRTGVSADKIVLGRVASVTGMLASYEAGWGPAIKAFIKAINEAGGIHGRKIELIIRDDQYLPPLAVQVTEELVEKDHVFAIFNYASGPTYDAVAEYLNANKVPSWWTVYAGAKWFYPTKPYSFSMSTGPDQVAGVYIAEAILSQTPDPKIAFVRMNNAMGEDQLEGAKYALQKAGKGQIVADISFDVLSPDLTPQAVRAAAANPDWVAFSQAPEQSLFSFLRALRQVAGYKGKVVQACTHPRTATSETLDGIYGLVDIPKDGYSDPNDSQVLTVKKFLEDRGVRYDASFSFSIAYTAVETLVRVLEIAGPDLTREGMRQAIYLGMDGSWKCTFCGEQDRIFTPEDHYADITVRLGLWSHANQALEWMGPIQSYETSEGTSVIGNMPGFECQPPSADHPKGTCPWKSQ